MWCTLGPRPLLNLSCLRSIGWEPDNLGLPPGSHMVVQHAVELLFARRPRGQPTVADETILAHNCDPYRNSAPGDGTYAGCGAAYLPCRQPVQGYAGSL